MKKITEVLLVSLFFFSASSLFAQSNSNGLKLSTRTKTAVKLSKKDPMGCNKQEKTIKQSKLKSTTAIKQNTKINQTATKKTAARQTAKAKTNNRSLLGIKAQTGVKVKTRMNCDNKEN